MSRPAVELADLLHKQGDRFMDQSPWLNFQQLSVLRAVARCRTAALGGHVDQCSHCGHQAISYNSCRNRHCPKCQAQARQRWLTAREKELLEVPYFHVVFTLPQELNPLCLRNARILYDLLFRASAATMLEVVANPKRLGAQIGFISILHTWGQNLLLHPHIHCVVPAGGLSVDHKSWIRPKYVFFLPVDVLSSVFRAKFVHGLRRAFRKRTLTLSGSIAQLANPKRFAAFVDSLFRKPWVVYAKPAFGAPIQVPPLSGQVHASRRHQQSPLIGLRWSMAVSALQWRNADRTKSLYPPTGIPVQASRQLVDQGRFCGPITCYRARPYLCLCPRIEPLPQRCYSVRPYLTSGPNLLKELKAVRSYTPQQRPTSKNTLAAP